MSKNILFLSLLLIAALLLRNKIATRGGNEK